MLFILGLPPDSRCKFFNPDPPVKKKGGGALTYLTLQVCSVDQFREFKDA